CLGGAAGLSSLPGRGLRSVGQCAILWRGHDDLDDCRSQETSRNQPPGKLRPLASVKPLKEKFMGSPARLMRWLGFQFGAVGFVLIGVCLWSVEDVRQFRLTARRAEGVVTRFELGNRQPGETSTATYAFVQFQDRGRTIEIRSRTGSSPPAFSVG